METRIDIREDTFLTGDITLGAFTFTFAAGKLEAGNGAVAHHRPDGIRMFSEFDNTCKTLAFAGTIDATHRPTSSTSTFAGIDSAADKRPAATTSIVFAPTRFGLYSPAVHRCQLGYENR